MKNYKEIKKELLENEEVYSVSIDSSRKFITIKPLQNKSYVSVDMVLEGYEKYDYFNGEYKSYYSIGNRKFFFYDCTHFNTNIIQIRLKEIC